MRYNLLRLGVGCATVGQRCLSIAFVEAALLCIWRLLSIARREPFLTTLTVRWVNALILSLAAGTGMLAAISAVLSSGPQTGGGGPAVGLGLMAGMSLGVALVLGVTVWRYRVLQVVRETAKQQRSIQP